MLNHPKANQIGTLFRHGDVLIKRIEQIPSGAQRREGSILAHGEVTGHSHQMQQVQAVQLWGYGNELFLEVKEAMATLVHEEHKPIELSQGFYRACKKRFLS